VARAAQRAVVLGTALAVLALLAAAPRPRSALAELRDAGAAADRTAPLVAAVSLLAWALTLWLLLTVTLTVVARRRGAPGRASGAVVRRIAPLAVRRAVEVTLGLSVAVAGVASPAVAGAQTPAAAPAAASLDWAGTPAPGLDWPAPEQEPATSVRAAPLPAADSPVVVVEPGDSLWGLAEQALAQRQGRSPSARQVAAAWPSWWAANREAVGEDPHLLLPGTPLNPPADPPAGP
jgi:hypothetical protein